MNTAVAQLTVVQIRFLGTLTSQFCYTSNSLAVAFVLQHFLLNHLSHIQVFVQIVIDLCLDEIADKLIDADTAIRFHCERTEFDFCLTLKLWFLNVDSDSSYDTVADIHVFIVLVEKLLDGTCNMLFECTLMGSSLNGMLSVDKRMVFFAILLIGMCERNLNIFASQVNNVVERLRVHRVFQQVFQSVAADDAAVVIVDFQSCVQVGIVAEHGFNKLRLEFIVQEEGSIGFEINIGTSLFVRVLSGIAL